MCWLLIITKDNPKETSYKIGDIVEIRPDDCNWGKKECLPLFYRVQITDMPFSERLQEICQRRDEVEMGGLNADGEPIMRMRRVRKHKIDISSIPTAIKNQLISTGIVKVTKAQIRNYLKDNAGTVVEIDG